MLSSGAPWGFVPSGDPGIEAKAKQSYSKPYQYGTWVPPPQEPGERTNKKRNKKEERD